MTGTNQTWGLEPYRPEPSYRDLGWYGTLAMSIASVCLLAIAFIRG